jgi:hypothetical protein
MQRDKGMQQVKQLDVYQVAFLSVQDVPEQVIKAGIESFITRQKMAGL